MGWPFSKPKSGAEPAGEATATVTNGSLVELFNQDGLPMYVPEQDAESWLRQGLSRERYDVVEEISAIGLRFDSAKRAVLAHAFAARSTGHVNRDAEAATAQAAFSELTSAYGRLVYALERAYPHQEPEGVEMGGKGEIVRVDPALVEQYRAAGYSG